MKDGSNQQQDQNFKIIFVSFAPKISIDIKGMFVYNLNQDVVIIVFSCVKRSEADNGRRYKEIEYCSKC